MPWSVKVERSTRSTGRGERKEWAVAHMVNSAGQTGLASREERGGSGVCNR